MLTDTKNGRQHPSGRPGSEAPELARGTSPGSLEHRSPLSVRLWGSMAHRAGLSTLLHSRRAQLLLLNSLTFGLEVCLAAGITYVPPLLLEVGVEEKFMTMVLGRQVLAHLRGTCFCFKG